MIVLRILGWLLLALALLVVSYVYWLSGSSHTPVNVLSPAPYASPGGPILVFGGTRATGLEIVRLLRERGEDVTVAVRATSNTDALKALGVRTVVADVLDSAQVTSAVGTAPFRAVISTVGTSRGDSARRPDFDGNRNIIDAARAAGIRRFLFVTVVGTGNSLEAAPLPARRALAEVIRLKGQAEDHLRASGLEYTIIRPGGLSEAESTGTAVLADDPLAFSYIARRDLAALSVAALGDPATIGKTYNAYDPSRKTLGRAGLF
jgi:uncharacterized protein YbjT (DUF2867 family)